MTYLLQALQRALGEFISLRRDIHRHPELAFEEHRTAALVADKLEGWGYAVERGIGGTGVVGTLVRGSGVGAWASAPTWTRCPSTKPAAPSGPACTSRRDACLRPRRPHGDAAGRGTPPGRTGLVRRHAAPDLPARRRRRRRRAAHDGRRPVRALPLRRGLRHAQHAGHRAGPAGAARRRDDGLVGLRHDHAGPVSAATARCRTARPTRSSPRPAS